jgi:hypothetical protein
MWTWTKTQQGCYLKNASEETTYVERFDEGRVSGGWDSSVHKDTNTFFDGDATSTTVQHAAFNDNGVMVDHENAGESHTAATEEGAVDHDVDHLHRRLSTVPQGSDLYTMAATSSPGTQCGATQAEWVAAWGSMTLRPLAQCREECLADATCTGIVTGTFQGIENRCTMCTSRSTASSTSASAWATYQAKEIVLQEES